MDILVNIAGVKGEQDWEAVYDVNLVKIPFPSKSVLAQKGVHLGLEIAWARMSKENGGKGGRVISVSSTCGVTCQVVPMQAQHICDEETGCLPTIFCFFGRRATCTQLQLTQLRNML